MRCMCMDKMSAKELKQFKELQAKYKRIQRAEKQFFAEADKHKSELLARWGITPNDEPKDSICSDGGAGGNPRPIQRDVGPVHM